MSVDGIFPAMPDDIYLKDKGKPACLIRALTPTALADWRDTLAGPHLAWMETAHFTAAAGEYCCFPTVRAVWKRFYWGWGQCRTNGFGRFAEKTAAWRLPAGCESA